jgi:stalled ribosome alternative rescue factor ArfA
VTKKSGDKVVVWDATDPIGKVVEVYASQYDDRVAVAYTVRRMGKEVTDVVAFDLGKPSLATPTPDPTTVVTPTAVAPPADSALTKAVAAGRKAAKGKALAAWKAVLTLDADHAEAHYQIAIALLGTKAKAEALAELTALAASSRPDAVEWLVEARFDPAFASLRADPTFRTKVGLDRKGTTSYEKLMGLGGQWEQTGTSCDKPEVRLTATRDRVVRIRVKSRCEGQVYDLPFKGLWRIDGNRVVLTFPNKGKQVSAADEAGCTFESAGDEDSLRCQLDRDIDFVVLPTRR